MARTIKIGAQVVRALTNQRLPLRGQDRLRAGLVARAHRQIEKKRYVDGLVERGIAPERIRTYGIAFRGKEVLIG